MARRGRVVRGVVTACVYLTLTGLTATSALSSTRYDPRLRFHTISTARFDIHFHQGEEAIARRLAAWIEDAAADVDAAVGPPAGRVQVILVDQHDLSNGWATPIPYNTIEISIAPPVAGSSIGNTDNWLRLVFLHEYTHIAHLSRASGWIGGLRRAFGRYPLLFPNLYQPLWAVEGIATWQESARTQRGRLLAGDFRLLLNRAAAADRFEPIDRVNGGNIDWPGGAGPYLYGAYFHQFLAERYGADSLRRLTDETSRRVPYFGSRAYKKVFGRPLGQLWNDFEAASKTVSQASADLQVTRLTHHGFTVSTPRIAPDGRIFYSAINPHRFPALMQLSADGRQPRRIADRFLGSGLGFAGDRIIIDEIELVRSVALKSDLYLVDRESGERRRLTREARTADPDVARDGVSVVCTVQMPDRRALATMQVPPPGQEAVPQVLVSEPDVFFAGPRWSPDGRWIVAERLRQGFEEADIVLVDVQQRTVRGLARLAGARSSAPSWMPDASGVVFSAAYANQPFQIYSVEIADGTTKRLEGTGASAQSPVVSADGRTLVYVGYTYEGYDLFSLPLADARWTPVQNVGPAIMDVDGPPAGALSSRPYSAWRTLAPQFWTPTIESDADELVFGAATGSADALGRHAWGVEAGWSERARPDWQIAYAYDRWLPTLFAAYADDTDPWRSGEARNREFDAGMLLRLARVRFSFTRFASVHVGDERFECASCSDAVDAATRRVSLRTGWEFSTARSFGYSVSAEEGGRVAVTTELIRGTIRDANASREHGTGFAATADARHYWRAWPRHGAVAVRGAAAASWGDKEARRHFSASGNSPQPGGFGFGRDAIGLLRGFDQGDVTGSRALVLNIDYRVPLMRIDRGVGTVPAFFRSLHGAVFVDVGHAWTDTIRWGDRRVSIGAEVSADAVLGFALPLTFTAGGAWRNDGTGKQSGFVTFGRVGRAF